jgi:hypothetical protein
MSTAQPDAASEYKTRPEDPSPLLNPDGQLWRTAGTILTETRDEPDWLIPGVIWPGATVKLAGREKGGKGTLVFYLIAKLARGEATVFGEAAANPVKTLIYTEEPPESIREKLDRFGIGGEDVAVVYGWQLYPIGTWAQKIAVLRKAVGLFGAGLLFIDNISRAAAIDDESGTELARAVEPLSEAAKQDRFAVLFDHHHRKGGGPLEDMSRGGTALAGATENNIELTKVGSGWGGRARRVSSKGRISATIWQQVIELTEDGTDYRETETPQYEDADDRYRALLAECFGGTGATPAMFAEEAGITTDYARRKLKQLVEDGAAQIVSDDPPKVYAAAGESENEQPPI